MKSWPEFASCQEIRGGGGGGGGSRRSGGRRAAESGAGAWLRRREPVRAPGGRAFPLSRHELHVERKERLKKYEEHDRGCQKKNIGFSQIHHCPLKETTPEV